MRLLIILLVLFAVVAAAGFWTNHQLETSTADLLENVDKIGVEIKKDNWETAYRKTLGLEKVWDRFLPGQPFEYQFVDDSIRAMYTSELQLRRMFGFFSALSIMVGCLGILGLVTYTAERRTKEIGIRKVLGAGNGGIVFLLSGDFLKLTVLSFAIAWPIAYLLVKDWLSGFTYRIEPGIWPFAIAGSLTLIIVVITVGTQAWRNATADPVKSLRYE